MQPGPPPTPTHLKLLRGNPGKRALPINEPMPLIPPAAPEPPAFVTGYAAEEWRRVAPELHRLGLLTKVDTTMLAAYCMAYARWHTAEEVLARMADRDEHTRALLITATDGTAKRNPLAKVAADATKDMLAFASQFGMTPASRTRIATNPDGPKGKFDGLLA
jgi:P27 family predicted phage terminase small subunit